MLLILCAFKMHLVEDYNQGVTAWFRLPPYSENTENMVNIDINSDWTMVGTFLSVKYTVPRYYPPQIMASSYIDKVILNNTTD